MSANSSYKYHFHVQMLHTVTVYNSHTCIIITTSNQVQLRNTLLTAQHGLTIEIVHVNDIHGLTVASNGNMANALNSCVLLLQKLITYTHTHVQKDNQLQKYANKKKNKKNWILHTLPLYHKHGFQLK